MSVFQFRKTPLHRQGEPVENTGNFTCDPRQHEIDNAVSTTSAESLAFFSSCASACARVSRWRSYSIVPGWRSRWPAAVLQPPGAAFASNFSIPFGIPFYDGGRVIKHLITLATASQNGHSLFLPVLNGTENRTENVSQLLFVDFHCSFHGQKQRKETTKAQKFVFSTCRFLSFSGGILIKTLSYDEEERKRLKPENFHK